MSIDIESREVSENSSVAQLSGTIVRNTTFVLGMQIALKILALFFNVFIIRRLGDIHFGRYQAVMAYVAIFGIFTDLGMGFYSLREMAANEEETNTLVPNIISIRVILSIFILGIAPLAAMMLGESPEIVIGVFIACVGLIIYAFQGPLDSALTARERFDLTSLYSIIDRLVFWSVGVLLLLTGLGFIGLILASIMGVGVFSLLAWRALKKSNLLGSLKPSLILWPEILRRSLPFGVGGFAYVLMQNFDTAFLSITLSDAAVGWYRAPYTLINMILLIGQSIAIALFPTMIQQYQANNLVLPDIVTRAMKYLLLISLPIAVGGSVLAEEIVLTLYSEYFRNSITVLRIIIWALPSLFLLELFGRVAFTLHLERKAARADVANALLTIILTILLVSQFGIAGAGLALVIGRGIRLFQFWKMINASKYLEQDKSKFFYILLSSIIMGVFVYIVRDIHLVLSILLGFIVFTILVLRWQIIVPSEIQYLSNAVFNRTRKR